MAYGEWCPVCGSPIVTVTRGIPSMGKCSNHHTTDRRDVLRREPTEEIKDAEIARLRTALAEAEARTAALVAGAYEAAALVCDKTAQEFYAEEDQDFCAPIAVRMASLAAEIRALAKKEAGAVKGGTISTGPHCDCGMIGPCMFEKCRHPLAANNGEAGE